jgi:hypothetical protein
MSQFNQNFITAIIDRYGLELDEYRVDNIVVTWLQKYDNAWIIKAIVESLHRGRYKVKSVDSILSGWKRIGKPCYKFTAEFEREILQNLPPIPETPEQKLLAALPLPNPHFTILPPSVLNSADLNPEESAPFQHHHSITAVNLSIEQREPILEEETQDNLVPPKPRLLVVLERENLANGSNNDEVRQNHLICQPAQFQLFRTLKAIVDPNHPQATESTESTELTESTNLVVTEQIQRKQSS